MSDTRRMPDFNLEIISPPDVNNATVSQVGQNLFSIELNIVMVIRLAAQLAPNMPEPDQITYVDETSPQPGGETAAFKDFVKQHGYSPRTREILVEWVQLQQGGA